MISIAEFAIHDSKDVKAAAQRARLLGTLVDLTDKQRRVFGRAVQELSLNALQHAGGGKVEFRLASDDGLRYVEAAIFDGSNKVDEVRSLIESSDGPACGLRRAAAAVDRLEVYATDRGKQLVAGVRIGIDLHTIDETVVAEWAGALRTRRTQSALASTQRRNRELAEQLSSLQKQRQELESDLQHSRSLNETLTLLSLVASKTDNAVIIMDEGGLTTWANDAFIRMTGYSSQEAVGARPDLLLSGPDTSSESLRELDQAFKLGHGVSEEFLQYRREGTTSWISLSLTPIHDDDGSVTRWIGIGTDTTKRKEAEKALKAARDAAETASQLKGEFLANVSHEIRTPMNAIIGMTDLTLCTELNDDQREYLTTVQQSAESLLELLNDVLDLSKIESGRLEIEESPFDLRKLIADTLKPLGFVAVQKGLRLDTNISPDVPSFVIGDALRLRQILVNLVGNAIKFTSHGHVEVSAQQQWQSSGETGLQFTISDTGIGIAAGKLDRIFEAFSQADASVSRHYGGTGLGLAITAQLLRLMNGRVWVQSEPGLGSRFHFTLRFQVATGEQQLQIENANEAAIAVHHADHHDLPSGALNVLVADDHPANRQLIARILEKQGHSMAFAENGHEALSLFTEQEFDVVLMDVQMPDMDGFQATAAIRQHEQETQSHVPIIAVTAHTMQGDRESCLAAGMDAYLSKPLSATELVTLVNSLSDNQVNVSAAAATSVGYVTVTDASGESIPSPPIRSSSDSKLFTTALGRLDNDKDLLIEQMDYFLADGPMLLDRLQEAASDDDRTEVQLVAHRLKNLCATFEDEQTAARCATLEQAAVADQSLIDAAAVQAGVTHLIQHVQAYRDQHAR